MTGERDPAAKPPTASTDDDQSMAETLRRRREAVRAAMVRLFGAVADGDSTAAEARGRLQALQGEMAWLEQQLSLIAAIAPQSAADQERALDRALRLRDRRRRGVRFVVHLDIWDEDLAALVEAGELKADESDDRQRVSEAVEDVFDRWIRQHRTGPMSTRQPVPRTPSSDNEQDALAAEWEAFVNDAGSPPQDEIDPFQIPESVGVLDHDEIKSLLRAEERPPPSPAEAPAAVPSTARARTRTSADDSNRRDSERRSGGDRRGVSTRDGQFLRLIEGTPLDRRKVIDRRTGKDRRDLSGEPWNPKANPQPQSNYGL